MKAALIPVGEKPCIIQIENSLEAMQKAVGGYIEVFDVLFDSKPCLYVNEEGLFTCQPNRAVYATKEMEQQGYLSQLDMRTSVKEGDLYAILFGDILAVSYVKASNGEITERDITDEEFQRIYEIFEDPTTGLKAVMQIRQ